MRERGLGWDWIVKIEVRIAAWLPLPRRYRDGPLPTGEVDREGAEIYSHSIVAGGLDEMS